MNKKAFYLNITIFLLELICFIWMFAGLSMLDGKFLSSNGISSFKYFTVLSNLFAGIMALIYSYFYKTNKKIPEVVKQFKLSSTSSVCLTLLVTAFFLVPQMGENFYKLYLNNNFFFHLVNPLLCIISYIFFESDCKLNKKGYIILLSPVILYIIFYILNIYLHEGVKNITYKYDFYGFTSGYLINSIFVVPIILFIITFISITLNWLKKRI